MTDTPNTPMAYRIRLGFPHRTFWLQDQSPIHANRNLVKASIPATIDNKLD